MIVKLVRNGLGGIIAGVSYITRPKPITRNVEAQASVNEAAKSLSIYQFFACPFCIKTRRAVHKLNIPVTYRDASKGKFREELEQEGGKIQVPCLKIENEGKTEWMYESSAIIEYLEKRFANTQ